MFIAGKNRITAEIFYRGDVRLLLYPDSFVGESVDFEYEFGFESLSLYASPFVIKSFSKEAKMSSMGNGVSLLLLFEMAPRNVVPSSFSSLPWSTKFGKGYSRPPRNSREVVVLRRKNS